MIRKRQHGNVAQPVVIVRKKKSTPASRPARAVSSRGDTQPAMSQAESLPPRPNRRQRKAQAPQRLLAVLRTRWPAAFPDDPRQVRPLMRGVHRDLAQRLPGTGLWLIKRAILLFQAVSGDAYWRVVLKGGPRYALDGSPCGEVLPREQEYARQTLAILAQRRTAKRPATAGGGPYTRPPSRFRA